VGVPPRDTTSHARARAASPLRRATKRFVARAAALLLAPAIAGPAAVVATTAVATLVPAPAGAQSRAELEKVLRRKTLSNGFEVVVVESHGVPIATVEIDVRNGSFTQTPEYAGLAHMFEHMFFKANADYPEPEQFVARASELGAVFNGSTQEERVNYWLTVSADSVVGAIEFLASAYRAPLFREDELAREKEVVLGEYDRNEASPFFEFQNSLTRALYPGHFSRKNTIGDRQVLRTVTPAKMRAIKERYYVPNNSVLIVTGDVDPDSIFAQAERALGSIPRGADPFAADPIPPIPALDRDVAVLHDAPTPGTVTVLLQWQGPSVRKDPGATYAADVFSDALNTPGSKFQARLVDSGLWRGVVVNYYTLNQVGPITISGQTSPERLREALKALDAEIVKLDDAGYFTADELESVKAQRATESAFGLERASALAHTIGFWWSVADLDYFMGYVDNMAAQKPADLQSYARRYIVGKPHVVGVGISAADRARVGLTEAELTGRQP
jgi:zinc protease